MHINQSNFEWKIYPFQRMLCDQMNFNILLFTIRYFQNTFNTTPKKTERKLTLMFKSRSKYEAYYK